MNKLRNAFVVLSLLGLVAAFARAGVITKKYPDGTVKIRYELRDDNGDKEGKYEEFYPTGKIKIKATYKDDKLDGPYAEFTEKGLKQLTASYKNGKLDGTLTRYEDGKPVLTQLYKDGAPGYTRSLADIKKALAGIVNAPAPAGRDPELEAAFRRLKAYRYLAEVPYDNIELDSDLSKHAEAAAMICSKLNRLDHNPKNPGLPEAQYKIAHKGAKNSNLGFGIRTLNQAVDIWMHDSDPNNIKRMGHRRWAINPSMGKVGFGKSGRFTAMWCTDRSAKTVPDFNFIPFPPRGLMPVEFFSPSHGWNVSLHPRKFKAPTAAVEVKIYQVDAMFNKMGEPHKPPFKTFSTMSMGVPYCLIFKPDPALVAPGRRYQVEIDGLVSSTGVSGTLRYVVEFTSLQ